MSECALGNRAWGRAWHVSSTPDPVRAQGSCSLRPEAQVQLEMLLPRAEELCPHLLPVGRLSCLFLSISLASAVSVFLGPRGRTRQAPESRVVGFALNCVVSLSEAQLASQQGRTNGGAFR